VKPELATNRRNGDDTSTYCYGLGQPSDRNSADAKALTGAEPRDTYRIGGRVDLDYAPVFQPNSVLVQCPGHFVTGVFVERASARHARNLASMITLRTYAGKIAGMAS
jgi:hypothetical protein